MTVEATQPVRKHVLLELGFEVSRAGDELVGSAPVVPEMFVPGTTTVRTSIMMVWADMLAGMLAVDVLQPRVPATLDLDVHLYEPPRDCETIHGVSRILKVGRSVIALEVDFTADDGRVIGLGIGSFMAAPDPNLRMHGNTSVGLPRPSTLLQVPFAERAGCERPEPGVAVMPRTEEGLNASGTVNGGLIALTVEEAVLSLRPGATLSSLAMRYLQPVRVGPVVATAYMRDGLARVEVRDAGRDDRPSVLATARLFDAAE